MEVKTIWWEKRMSNFKNVTTNFKQRLHFKSGNSNRYVYRNFWVYDGFWKLHIFQLKIFLQNVDQIKRYFIFGILSHPTTLKKTCVLIFQVLPNILSSMYLLYTIGCLLRVKMEALLRGIGWNLHFFYIPAFLLSHTNCKHKI